jgi:DNA replication and repair protein RecF
MKLKSLSLTQYKNITSKNFEFDAQINCFIGNNGVGKSNILDAIYHLCFAKGYFNPTAVQNIQFDTDYFVLDAVFEKNERVEKILCSLKRGHKKTLKRNGKVYEKISDHIGLLPLVIISPSDRDLINEGSSIRRKFMDGVIGQTDPVYLNNLMDYTKIVSQRNALLKYFAVNQTFDAETLEIYNQQMIALGTPIHEKRKAFLETFISIFEQHYQSISRSQEEVTLSYESALLNNSFEELLKNQLAKDRMLQFSSTGIHKEDLFFSISDEPIKKFGSQGQQKSFLIALKLAQFDFIKKQAGVTPIVLLDDVFDKLDQQRVSLIMQLVENNHFGQLFLSDTHEERTLQALKTTQSSYKIFNLN